MGKRYKAGIGHVVRAPSLDKGVDAFIDIGDLEPDDLLWWNAYVQKVIDEDPARPDYRWNWNVLSSLPYAYSKIAGQHPRIKVVRSYLSEEIGRSVPVALILVVKNYWSLNDQHKRKRAGFLWYLSSAPREALEAAELEDCNRKLKTSEIPKMIGTIALDVAVTETFNSLTNGRLGTHAHKKGKERLIEWYEEKKMIRLPEETPIPLGFRSVLVKNDGRYLYYTVENSVEFSRVLDPLREMC